MIDDYDYDFYDSAFNDCLEIDDVNAEVTEELDEESVEEVKNEEEIEEPTLKEFVRMALQSQQESTPMTVEVENFDKWDSPLNDCSAFTITALIIFFFLALATIGGVLNE